MTAPLIPVNARVYTRTELDRGVCADCGWPHAVVGVGPKCHPRSPMHARYERASGTIVLALLGLRHRCGDHSGRVGGAIVMFGLPLIDPRLMSDDDLRELSACVVGGALLDSGLARQLLDHATGLRAALDAQIELCARQRELLGAIEKLSRGEVAP